MNDRIQLAPVPHYERTDWTDDEIARFQHAYYGDWARNFKQSRGDWWAWDTDGMCARLSTGDWGAAAVAAPHWRAGMLVPCDIIDRSGRWHGNAIHIRVIVDGVAFGHKRHLGRDDMAWITFADYAEASS